jgi:hypothetical protein
MANAWFRLYSEFAVDPKVQSMTPTMQRHLVMLLCFRCGNVLATLHDDEISVALRVSCDELKELKDLFVRKGFINEKWDVLNWDKRQYISDKSTERSRKHRELKKQELQRSCNVSATPPDTDTDTETDIKKINKKRKFEKPNDVSESVWLDFENLRKAKKAPISETAITAIRKEAEKIGYSLEKALEECVARGWQGFKAEWMKDKNGKPMQPATTRPRPQASDWVY